MVFYSQSDLTKAAYAQYMAQTSRQMAQVCLLHPSPSISILYDRKLTGGSPLACSLSSTLELVC